LLAAARLSHGQAQAKIERVGFLWFSSLGDPSTVRNGAAFRDQLSVLGHVDGKNLLIEERSAAEHPERLSELAHDLVASHVDIIVAAAVAASVAAQNATKTIPIVMVNAGDPVSVGLIASLARPGGNVTGTTNLSYAGKQIELIRELVPRARKLAVLLNPSNAGARRYVEDAMAAGRRFDLSIVVAAVEREEDFPDTFAMIRNMRPDGLLVMTEPLIGGHRNQVIAFAAETRLPASYDNATRARDGGLISYGPVFMDHYVMAARYVDKLIKGAKPADLPVEQPTRFELIVNSKTARSLALPIPQSMLVHADEVIQ